jgi:hypothetical protein
VVRADLRHAPVHRRGARAAGRCLRVAPVDARAVGATALADAVVDAGAVWLVGAGRLLRAARSGVVLVRARTARRGREAEAGAA